MKKQNQRFNIIIYLVSTLALLFITLGFIKNCAKTNSSVEKDERPTIPVTQVEIPIVKDKDLLWYLNDVKDLSEYYYQIIDEDNSLKGQLTNCINIIYTSFNIDFSSENFKEQLFGDMSEQYIGPTQLANSLIAYNKKNNINNIELAILPNTINIEYLKNITNNNYPIIVWYSMKTMGEKDYFDGYAYWGYAKPLIVYSIDEEAVHAIDIENGYISININTFETTWSKCGNRAMVIG